MYFREYILVLNCLFINIIEYNLVIFCFFKAVPMRKDFFHGIIIIVFENGHAWNERRRWTFGALRNLCLEKNNLENRINLEADYLCQEINKHDDSFNPLHCVNNAVSNIVCTVCFGDRFEYSDYKFKELIEGIQYIFKHHFNKSSKHFSYLILHTNVQTFS